MGKAKEAPPPGKIWQEFYCTTSGGGCGGYIMVRINMAINGVVSIICPSCKHVHGRIIENGHIVENWSGQSHSLGGRNDKTTQEIVPLMSAYSKTPRTAAYIKGFTSTNERNSPVVKDPDKDLARAPELIASWEEKHGVKT